MARIQPAQPEAYEPGRESGRGRRAVRYAVPVAVAGIAAATIGLVPALADSGDPSLPSVTAAQLLTKIAGSDVQTLDGTVTISTDLGLPDALTGGAGSGLFGGSGGLALPGSGDGTSPAAPQRQLTQLLTGSHRLHVAADGPDRQKLSVIEPAAEYSVIHNGDQLWGYDSKSDQAYHQTLPRQRPPAAARQTPEDFPATPQAAAKEILKDADGTASITVDGTARVAGHSAYELVVTPQHADSTTVGDVRIAVDAKTGVPLRFTLVPKGGGKAVFDVRFTKVSFAKPAASTFAFTPGKGVKVTEGGTAAGRARQDVPGNGGAGPTVVGKGWDAVAAISTGLPSGAVRNGSDKGADSLLNRFGKQVSGSYGTGTVFHTRLVNALLTDDGTLYVGAVTPTALTDAASAAK